MTIKELYEIAKKNKVENYEIKLQYQDDGGCYCGNTLMDRTEYNHGNKEVILS